SALSDTTINLIKKAQQQRGVIVITDPDFNGQKIRQKIMTAVPQAKQVYLRRQDSVPANHQGSLGLEHASAAVIKQALEQVWTPLTQAPITIAQQQLVDWGLLGGADAQKLRSLVGDILHIGYANAKQFPRRLAMFAISAPQLQAALKQAKEELYGS
ncbi:ribonuclease M5, partial [Lactobacillus sp. XV13L]|nr:ribonuclease M5 [Lactobacillus sp. XV13L]